METDPMVSSGTIDDKGRLAGSWTLICASPANPGAGPEYRIVPGSGSGGTTIKVDLRPDWCDDVDQSRASGRSPGPEGGERLVECRAFGVVDYVSFPLQLRVFGADAPTQTTRADIDRWMTELSNWGRWGKTDQIGTVNLITPAKRRETAALVKDGISISLAHDTLTVKSLDNDAPFTHKMLYTGAHPNGDWLGLQGPQSHFRPHRSR